VRAVFDGLLAHPAARAATGLILGMSLLLSPSPVAAHVTRVVGPYTFLIVLIEEPFFQDNHAGFEFWVRDGDRPVAGLDRTLRAEAISRGSVVKLSISPRNDRGFYDAPFYPGSGGQYSLHLAGSIEGTAIDELFMVNFPAYPRAPLTKPAAGAASVPEPTRGWTIGLVAGATAVLMVLSTMAFVVARRRRPAGNEPDVRGRARAALPGAAMAGPRPVGQAAPPGRRD
jgi:hypothetical protein